MQNKYYPKEFISMLKILTDKDFKTFAKLRDPDSTCDDPYISREENQMQVLLREYEVMRTDIFDWLRQLDKADLNRILNEVNKEYVIQILGKD